MIVFIKTWGEGHVLFVTLHFNGGASGAPYLFWKAKETHKLIFLWLSWLAEYCSWAHFHNEDGDGNNVVVQDGGHTAAK